MVMRPDLEAVRAILALFEERLAVLAQEVVSRAKLDELDVRVLPPLGPTRHTRLAVGAPEAP